MKSCWWGAATKHLNLKTWNKCLWSEWQVYSSWKKNSFLKTIWITDKCWGPSSTISLAHVLNQVKQHEPNTKSNKSQINILIQVNAYVYKTTNMPGRSASIMWGASIWPMTATSLPVILCLQEAEFLFDAITWLSNGELKWLTWLVRTLPQRETAMQLSRQIAVFLI